MERPSPRLDMRRILIEGIVIVASILLAFAIDAAWDGVQERRRTDELVRALRDDVVETREYMTRVRAQRQELVGHSRAGSGDLALLPDPDLREALGRYHGSLAVFAERGEPARALRASRRRGVLNFSEALYRAPFLRQQAMLAARLGEREEAIAAHRRYLDIRARAEPGSRARAEYDAARSELEALLGESR